MVLSRRIVLCAAAAIAIASTAHTVLAGSEMMPDTESMKQTGVVRLLPAEKEERLRKQLPDVDDYDVRKLLGDERLMLYTNKEMPPAYQDWGGDLQGVHSPSYNISANGSEPFGNGNREFPWSTPAGAHRAKNVQSFRFLWLPTDEKGAVRPVVWYRKRLAGDTNDAYLWLFPVGTVLGEVLTLPGPDNRRYTFEMRLRVREVDSWGVNVFRPFPESADLVRRIKELRPDYQNNEKLASLVAHLEAPLESQRLTLVDRHPSRLTFKQSMGVDELPAVGDERLIAELLSETTFESALGAAWRRGPSGEAIAFAPTTKSDFHIVPASYDAGFVEVDRQSCMRCHETVSRHVSVFQPGRDWYGRIRGSDGIFSFHPFALGSISDNGYSVGVKLRRAFLDAGVVEQYDDEKHSNLVYRPIRGLVY